MVGLGSGFMCQLLMAGGPVQILHKCRAAGSREEGYARSQPTGHGWCTTDLIESLPSVMAPTAMTHRRGGVTPHPYAGETTECPFVQSNSAATPIHKYTDDSGV